MGLHGIHDGTHGASSHRAEARALYGAPGRLSAENVEPGTDQAGDPPPSDDRPGHRLLQAADGLQGVLLVRVVQDSECVSAFRRRWKRGGDRGGKDDARARR
jgi:hypothetical protein